MKGTGSTDKGGVDFGVLFNRCAHVGFQDGGSARSLMCANIMNSKSLAMPR